MRCRGQSVRVQQLLEAGLFHPDALVDGPGMAPPAGGTVMVAGRSELFQRQVLGLSAPPEGVQQWECAGQVIQRKQGSSRGRRDHRGQLG